MAGDAVASAVGWAVGCAEGSSPVPPSEPPEAFVASVRRHRVGALLHAAGWGEAAGAPAETRAALAADAQTAVLAGLRAVGVQRELVTGLEQSGIGVVVLKGPALAVQAHGALFRRHVGDLDLLVDPRHVAGAVTALEARGFTATAVAPPGEDWRGALSAILAAPDRYPLLKDVTLRRGDDSVDLHWRLFGNRHLLPVGPGWLASPARIDVAGVSTPVLPPAALWRYVNAHGTHHRWERLKWLADVPALALRHPELLSPEALREIEQDGLARCVACGVLVAEETLGPFLPDHARRWAHAVPGTAPLVGEARAALASDELRRSSLGAREAPAFLRMQMAARADARYRREELRRMLLRAGRAGSEADPGLAAMTRAPARWVARTVRSRSSRLRP